MPRKYSRPVDLTDDTVEEVQSVEAELVDEKELPAVFAEFIQSHNLSRDKVTCRVYRIEGKEKQFLEKRYNDVPDEDEVGELYGRGRYYITLQLWDKERKKLEQAQCAYNLHDPVWDERHEDYRHKRDRERARMRASTAPAVQPMGGAVDTYLMAQRQTMEMMTGLIGAFAGMFGRGDAKELMELQSKLFQNQLEQQEKILGAQRMIYLPEETEVQDESPDMTPQEMVKLVVELIVEKAGEFIQLRGPKKIFAKRAITSSPEYARIVSDPALLDEVVAKVTEQIGEEKAAIVKQEFGLNNHA